MYFIDHAIILVPIFTPLPPPPIALHSLRQSPQNCSCPWVMYIIRSLATPSPVLYFISPWLFCNYLSVFLFLSLLHPFSYTPLPSGNHQNALCIHYSISVLLIFLVCFLDLIVGRYAFIAILLFVVLILFFLNKSL